MNLLHVKIEELEDMIDCGTIHEYSIDEDSINYIWNISVIPKIPTERITILLNTNRMEFL